MILTSIPPRLLHRVRDGAAYLHDLATLGLAILCPCDGDHGRRLRELGPDEPRGEHVVIVGEGALAHEHTPTPFPMPCFLCEQVAYQRQLVEQAVNAL